MTLRAGLIGLGMIGRHHARVLQHLDGVDLVAVADAHGDTHRAAPGVPLFAGIDDLLHRGLDYCVVATPTNTHADIGRRLAQAGIPALIEKPLAAHPGEATMLREAFADASVPAAVGHIERYNPAIQALRSHLSAGALGQIYQVATRRQGPYPPRIADVGVVLDLATHDIDIVAFITGRSITSVAARTSSRSGRHHEDLVAALCLLDDATISSHLVNWLSPLKERVTIVTGERGCLVADTLHADLTFFANGSTPTPWAAAELFRGVTEGDVIRYAIPKKEPLVAEHEAFRDLLTSCGNEVVSLAEGAATVSVAHAMLTSAQSGTPCAPATGAPAGYWTTETPSSR